MDFKRIAGIVLLIIGFGAVMYQTSYRIAEEQVKIWDESSTASNAAEMYENGISIVVKKNGVPDHHDTRPPLSVWTKVVSYNIFGLNEFGVRFPTLLSVIILSIFLLGFMLSHMKDINGAVVLLFLMATTRGFMGYHVARNGDPDTMLLLFTTVYSVVFFVILEKRSEAKWRYFLILVISVFLAYMTKSIAGLAPLAGLVIYNFTQKSGFKLLINYKFHLSWAFVLISIVGYYVIRESFDPGYWDAVFKQEFNKVGDDTGYVKHDDNMFYVKYLVKDGFRTLIYLLLLGLVSLFFGTPKSKRLILFSILGAGVYLLAQSFVVIKNEWYISPIYPFFWLIIATGFSDLLKIVHASVSNEKIRIAVKVLVYGSVLALLIPMFGKITNRNVNSLDKGYVYEPERAGFLVREFSRDGHLKDDSITIAPVLFDRQLRFYMIQQRLDNNTIYNYERKLPDTLISGKKYLLIGELPEYIQNEYNYKVIFDQKYGQVIEIK